MSWINDLYATFHDDWFWPWLPWICLTLVLLCLFFSLRAGRLQILIDNLPSSKTTGVFMGLVELKGTAEADPPLKSMLAEVPCVYFRFEVRERKTVDEREDYTDSDGRSQSRTVSKTSWQTVATGVQDSVPFFLKDDRGIVRIQPKGARFEPQSVLNRTCRPSDPLYDRCMTGELPGSDHVREFKEEAIRLHAPIFVVGVARQRSDIAAAEIAADSEAPLFLISTRSEESVRQGYRFYFWLIGLFGLIFVVMGLDFREDHLHARHANAMEFARGCVIYLVVWLAAWIVMLFNSLIDLRQRVRKAWANIDVELKRRADLLPNINRIVTGLLEHERNVLPLLNAMRAQGGVTAPGKAGPDPVALAGALRAVAEAYPALKSADLFPRWQKQLTDTEDRIALARGYFNDIATFYNTRLSIFPDGLLAGLAGMRIQPLMNEAGFIRPPTQMHTPGSDPTR